MIENEKINIILKIAYANTKNSKEEVEFFKTLFDKPHVLLDENKVLFLKMLNQFQEDSIDTIFKEPKYTNFIHSFLRFSDLLNEDIHEKLFHRLANFIQKPTSTEEVELCFKKF